MERREFAVGEFNGTVDGEHFLTFYRTEIHKQNLLTWELEKVVDSLPNTDLDRRKRHTVAAFDKEFEFFLNKDDSVHWDGDNPFDQEPLV